MTEPIPQEELDRVLRKTCRRLAATLIRAMAETDTSFSLIAKRVGRSEWSLRRGIRRLIDGDGRGFPLDFISDFAIAMGCEIVFTLERAAVPAPVDAPDALGERAKAQEAAA
jgi:hypothetical protein